MTDISGGWVGHSDPSYFWLGWLCSKPMHFCFSWFLLSPTLIYEIYFGFFKRILRFGRSFILLLLFQDCFEVLSDKGCMKLVDYFLLLIFSSCWIAWVEWDLGLNGAWSSSPSYGFLKLAILICLFRPCCCLKPLLLLTELNGTLAFLSYLGWMGLGFFSSKLLLSLWAQRILRDELGLLLDCTDV